MPNDIGVKMGVSGVDNFKKSMSIATQNVKTLDQALKLNEKQLQATGDKEAYLQQKSKLLQQQIAEQTKVINEGQKALKSMDDQGVKPASAAYQKMQQQVLNAQAALLDMQGDLGSVGQSAEETAQKTDKLTDSLNGINKKVSFDAVLNGIGKITDGMEAAARKVATLAGNIWDEMLTAAAWADDLGTRAEMFGIDTETLQKMDRVAEHIQTPVNAIFTAKQKIEKNMHDMSESAMEAFAALGLVVTGKFGEKAIDMSALSPGETGFDFIFEIGKRLAGLDDEILRDVYAQQLMGKSWREMLPLINAGKDAYLEALAAQNYVSKENVDNLNELSAKVKDMDAEWTIFKRTVEGELAGAFSTLAGSITDVLTAFNEYLDTPEGREKLEALAGSLTDIFSDLSNTDVAGAVGALSGALGTVKEALKWISDHSEDVIKAIRGIGVAFIRLKVAEAIGSLAQGANALKQLLGKGGAGTAGAAAAGSSASIAAGAAAVTKITTGSKLLDALGIGALSKTAREASEQLGTGLWGAWAKKQQMQEMTIAGFADPETGAVYPIGGPLKRKKNITGTASEDSMKGAVQLSEERIQAIYDELYRQINDYDQETNMQDKATFFENVLKPLVGDAMAAGNVPLEAMDGIAALFKKKFLDSFEEDWEGSTSGILNILQEAIDEAAADGLAVKTKPDLVDNAAQLLQEQMSSVTLHVSVIPDMAAVPDGSHANGLPFVPFDGYIAVLHKGERVVPANVNKSSSFTSNVYFDRTSLHNGVDADGLAARIADANRHIMAGFGS